jgi:hypothetical protein
MAESMNMEMSVTAQRFKKNSKSEKSKRHGAPKGHRGATRQKPEQDRIEWKFTADRCEHCGSTNLEECGVKKKVVEEIPPPPKIEIIQFKIVHLFLL